MKTIEIYKKALTDAYGIATLNFNNSASKEKTNQAMLDLTHQLEHDSFIKIPFVGDFNAGKSSSLNALMGIDLLPTNIIPETAVSYELYYSEKEYLEIWNGDTKKATKELSSISLLDLTPSDLVKLYINNDIIRHYNERNIILVDMPGIDSGIAAHNNAILNYVKEGTHFVICVEAEQGTLRTSTISFIEELKKYQLSASVVITKADKKPESELLGIANTIASLTKRLLGDDAKVATISAMNKNTTDLATILDAIDAEKVIEAKYESQVAAFISDIAAELQLQINLLLSTSTNYAEKIAQLKTQKEDALNMLVAKDREAQSVSSSAEDILSDIRSALQMKSSYLATVLFQSNNDTNLFNAELMSIIRPILMNSFKREISEYQDAVGSAVQEFSLKVNDILTDKDNQILAGAQDLAGNLLGKEVLEGILKKGLDKLAAKLVAYKGLSTLLKSLTKILGPVVIILVNILPDLIRLIFGKSKEQKIQDISTKLNSEVFIKVIDSLRPELEKMLEEQRSEIQNDLANLISAEAKKYDDNINEVMKQQEADKSEREAKACAIQQAIVQLNQIVL